jgi:hypothetical protein
MIELMGGTLGFTSTPGSGTTAKMEIPLSIDAQSPMDTSESDKEAQTQAHIRVLGMKSKDGPALSQIGASLKRQLKSLNCQIVRTLSEADLIVVEEHCSLAPFAEELQQGTMDGSKRVIMLGSATSANKNSPPKHVEVDGRSIPVVWMFRPLLPNLVDKIIAATPGRVWEEHRTLMPSPELKGRSTTTDSDKNLDSGSESQLGPARREAPRAQEASPCGSEECRSAGIRDASTSTRGEFSASSMTMPSDPIIPSLTTERPRLEERLMTAPSAPTAASHNTADSDASGIEEAFKGESIVHL